MADVQRHACSSRGPVLGFIGQDGGVEGGLQLQRVCCKLRRLCGCEQLISQISVGLDLLGEDALPIEGPAHHEEAVSGHQSLYSCAFGSHAPISRAGENDAQFRGCKQLIRQIAFGGLDLLVGGDALPMEAPADKISLY